MTASIDWRYWRISPEIQQWEACALSLGLNPESMRRHPQAWMAEPSAGPIFTNSSFPNREAETEFKKRQRLLEASVFTSGFFPTVRGLVMGARWKATIRLNEFATWMAHIGLDMPPELYTLHEPASKPQATPPSEPVTPAAAAPPVETPVSKTQKAAEGVTKNQILAAFDALVTTTNLSKAMADGMQWAVRARVSKGTRGRGGHESLWNPLLMAVELCERKLATKADISRAFFKHNFLADWREQWTEQSDEM